MKDDRNIVFFCFSRIFNCSANRIFTNCLLRKCYIKYRDILKKSIKCLIISFFTFLNNNDVGLKLLSFFEIE